MNKENAFSPPVAFLVARRLPIVHSYTDEGVCLPTGPNAVK